MLVEGSKKRADFAINTDAAYENNDRIVQWKFVSRRGLTIGESARTLTVRTPELLIFIHSAPAGGRTWHRVSEADGRGNPSWGRRKYAPREGGPAHGIIPARESVMRVRYYAGDRGFVEIEGPDGTAIRFLSHELGNLGVFLDDILIVPWRGKRIGLEGTVVPRAAAQGLFGLKLIRDARSGATRGERAGR